MQELASLVLSVDTRPVDAATVSMDKATSAADRLNAATDRLAKAGAAASSSRSTKVVDDERRIEEALGREILAIQKNTAAYERMQAQAAKATSLAGIRSPQAVAAEMRDIAAMRDMWEQAGKSTQGYAAAMSQITARTNVLTEGNARARGAIRETAAAMASLAFEAAGAAFLVTAVGGALAAPAFFGTSMLKRVEDAQTGIAGILMSMGTLGGKALTFEQSMAASGEYVRRIQEDSLKFGIEMGKLVEVNQAAMSGGLAAMLTLDQIQKVATAGAIAVSSLGLNSQQYVQEVRDLISGGIQPASSTLARSIGVTDALLKQWKAEGPDKLVGELTSRLEGFMLVADKVRASTLTGAWDILQARLSVLLSDTEGFGALKKAVIGVADYIGTVDPISKKFTLNPEIVDTTRAYWDVLKGIGTVFGAIGGVVVELAWPMAKLANMVSMAAIEFQMLFVTATTGFKQLALLASGTLTGNFSEALSKSSALGKEWDARMSVLGRRLGETGASFFGLGEDVKASTDAMAGSASEWSKITGKAADDALKNYQDYANKHKTASRQHQDSVLEESKLFYAAQLEEATRFSDKMVRLQSIADMKRNLLASDTRSQSEKEVLLAGLTAKEQALASSATSPELEKLRKARVDIKTGGAGPAHISEMARLEESMKAQSEAVGTQLSNADKVELAWNKLSSKAQTYTEKVHYLKALELARGIDAKALAAEEEKQSSKYIAHIGAETEALMKKVEQETFDTASIGKTKDELAMLQAVRFDNVTAMKEQVLASLEINFGNEKEIAAVREQIKVRKDLKSVLEAQAAAQKVEEIAKPFQAAFDSVLKSGTVTANRLATAFSKTLGDAIRDAIISAVYDATTKKQSVAAAKMVIDLKKQVEDLLGPISKQAGGWLDATLGKQGGGVVRDLAPSLAGAIMGAFNRQANPLQAMMATNQYTQQWQGTGTVLGDIAAKSTSISGSLDILNKTTFGQTPYLAQMSISMNNVDKNMNALLTQVAKSVGVTGLNLGMGIVSSTQKVISDGLAQIGDAIGKFMGYGPVGSLLQGLFGSTTTTVTGMGVNFAGTTAQLQQGMGGKQYTSGVTSESSLFGLSSSTSVWTQYAALSSNVTKALGAVFQSVSDTIKTAAVAIGGNIGTLTQQLDAFVINTGNVSMAGMTVQQQQETLNNIVSKQSDLMVAAVVPTMTQFQVAGEGLLQTLVRVVAEVATFDSFLQVLGSTTKATTTSADAMVKALGGVDQANQLMTKFVQNFASDSIKGSVALKNMTVAFEAIGLKGIAPLIRTTEDFYKLMQVASTDQQVALLKQQDTVLQYIQTISKAISLSLDQASKAAGVTKNELGYVTSNLSSLASSLKGVATQMYQSLVKQMTPDYQRIQYQQSLAQIGAAYQQYKTTGVAPNAASLQQAIGVVGSGNTSGMFATATDWKRGTLQTIEALNGMGNLADAQLTVTTQISNTMDKMLATAQEQLSALNAGNVVAANDAAQRLTVLGQDMKWLEGVSASLVAAASQNSVTADVMSQVVTASINGQTVIIDTLQKLIVSAGTTMTASGATTGVGGATSAAGAALPAGTPATALATSGATASLAAFNAALASATAGLSSPGVGAQTAAQLSAQAATANQTQAVQAAAAQTAAAQAAAAQAARVKAKADALAALTAAQKEVFKFNGVTYLSMPTQAAAANAYQQWYPAHLMRIQQAQLAYDTLPAFAMGGLHKGGLRIVGENGPELEYTGPSEIVNSGDTKALLSNEDVVNAVNELRGELRAIGLAIAAPIQKSYKIFDRWDGEGMPEVREAA